MDEPLRILGKSFHQLVRNGLCPPTVWLQMGGINRMLLGGIHRFGGVP